MNIEAILENYMNNPKWEGKIFMEDEKICYKDGFNNGVNSCLERIEQLKQGLKLYKKALELFVNWADECDFGYDNLGDLYSEYKDEIESLKYQEGLIHIAVSEAKKELADERC